MHEGRSKLIVFIVVLKFGMIRRGSELKLGRIEEKIEEKKPDVT
jgi:hypothetical protein